MSNTDQLDLWGQAHRPAGTPATDAPVLRNELWEAMRSIARGTWTVAVHSGSQPARLVAMQDYVVDDHGNLQALSAAANVANAEFYASTYAIDQAACEWMDQFSAPAQPRPVPTGATTAAAAAEEEEEEEEARSTHTPPAAQAPVRAQILDEPYYPFCSASVVLGDDTRPAQPLYSIHAPGGDRLLVTHTQLCALALALALLHIVKPAPRGATLQ